MRIIYGVAGEGFGHSSRAKEMISHLQKQGHEVLVIAYSQSYQVLHNIFPTYKVEGIHLKFDKSGLNLVETIKDNLDRVKKNIQTGEIRDEKIQQFNPQIAITDFEPVTALLAYKLKIPLISIDNQHRLTHQKISVPKEYLKNFMIAKTATLLNPPKADAYIILSFSKSKPLTKNAYIVSPILRNIITKIKTREKNFILVYQTKPDNSLLNILKSLPYNFIVYGYDKEQRDKNLIFKKPGIHFVNDLAVCKALIASSGFSLMSEALYLKKPYFAIPLKGQFEQTLNSLFLQQSGFGEFSESPSKKQIQNFLSNLNKYKTQLKKYKSNPLESFEVMDKVIKKIKK